MRRRKFGKFDGIQFKTNIHTLQLKSREMIYDMDDINKTPYANAKHTKSDKITYKINPNKLRGDCQSYYDFVETMREIAYNLGIEEEYRIERADIALNTTTPFLDLYKINNYLAALIFSRKGTRNKDSYFTMDRDFTLRNISGGNRDFHLAIYNKEAESQGRTPWRTRIEFRCMRIGKGTTLDEVIKSLLDMLTRLPEQIENLNDEQSWRLYQLYNQESQNGHISSFTEFVGEHAVHIYNREILKRLHNAILSGNFDTWLRDYRRRGRTITLYNRGDIAEYIRILKSALRKYLQNVG